MLQIYMYYFNIPGTFVHLYFHFENEISAVLCCCQCILQLCVDMQLFSDFNKHKFSEKVTPTYNQADAKDLFYSFKSTPLSLRMRSTYARVYMAK